MTNSRNLKVYAATAVREGHGMFAYQKEEKVIPQIRMQGMWLEKLGFHPGDTLKVQCEDGRLIIEKS